MICDGWLNQLGATIRFHNGEKGFARPTENLERKLLLAVSEICEAQEELRDGHKIDEIYYKAEATPDTQGISVDKTRWIRKPCGFPTEIADAII